MKLESRLLVAFLVTAWLPLGGAVALLTDRMERAFAEGFRVQSQAASDAVLHRFDRVARELDGALVIMSQDTLLDAQLLQPLERGRFYGYQEREREMIREAERLITSLAVDTLRLVDLEQGGRVIAMGHRRGEEPDDAVVAGLAPEASGARIFRHERVENRETGTADSVWTLQVIRLVGERVALVGGRVLDDRLLADLLTGTGETGAVALVARGGERVAATFDGEAPPEVTGGYEVAETALRNPGADEPILTLRVWISRSRHARTASLLWATAGGLAGVSGLLAFLLALWTARRISRPLERLSSAAGQVADGRRDLVVPDLPGRDEVASLTRAFNRMTRDLGASEERLRRSERIAAWREIARRIAHEIKNPLFPIQMSIENLQKARARELPDFDEIFDEATATILEEVERLKRIVTEFSSFARMPAPRPHPTDLAELCRQLAGLHAEAAPGVRLAVRGPDSVMAEVDPDQIRQVLTNLVLNGLDAMAQVEAAAGTARNLEITIEEGEGDVRVTVADDGPGMDRETLGRIFTPYFTTKPAGTGLGLAIVQRIVAEHAGGIEVTSAPGEGTRFAVTLPRRARVVGEAG